MSTTIATQQSRWSGKLTREFSDTGTGTVYFSTDKTLGVTEGWFDFDPENSKAETAYLTGITGTIAEYSGTVVVRGLREYGANSNVGGNQKKHRATAKIIISDYHGWFYALVAAFNAHEDLSASGFHGIAGIGTTATRPAAAIGNANMLYASTDDLVVYFSDGVDWHSISAGTQPDATTGVKGVTKLSVAPVSAALPISVGDNDTRLTSAANMTDLTDAGDTTLHYHAADRARANHTGTQTLNTILESGTAGEALATDDLIYYDSAATKWKKGADTSSSWNISHIVVTGGALDASITFRPLIGRIALGTPLAANTTYYKGAGVLTPTRPATNSSSNIPVIVGTTDAAGNLVCAVKRIQRVKMVQQTLSSNPTTVTVGFPMLLVEGKSTYFDGTQSQYTSGVYDVLTNTMYAADGNTAYFLRTANASSSTTVTVSVTSDNLVFVPAVTGGSVLLTIYEAL